MTTVPSLGLICEKVLLQNYLMLRDIGDVRFSLIKNVLYRLNPQQLINLEVANPKLILEDEPIWYNLVKKEFPQNIHKRFTTNHIKIKTFYTKELDQLHYDHSHINISNYIVYEELGNTKKYRLPSKLLYLKYQEDLVRKEELAIQNLRQRMADLKQAREANQVVQLDSIIPVDNQRPKAAFRSKHERSKIFMKSQKEAQQRKELFKNPRRAELQIQQHMIRKPKGQLTSASKAKALKGEILECSQTAASNNSSITIASTEPQTCSQSKSKILNSAASNKPAKSSSTSSSIFIRRRPVFGRNVSSKHTQKL